MKVSATGSTQLAQLQQMRRFFIIGFIQNVVARYYTQKRAWSTDIRLYCSYPTEALRGEYYTMLKRELFPGGAFSKNQNFYSEAISFVCYGPQDNRDAVTIDIGAGTTDIALCRFGGSEMRGETEVRTWKLKRTASLQFAGMRIVEQSIIESLRKDGKSPSDIFGNLDDYRKEMLLTLKKNSENLEPLRMLVRNLISDHFLIDPEDFPIVLKIRMVLRTIGVLLVVRDMLDDSWSDYELFLHGGPIKSLGSEFKFGQFDLSFEAIVQLIFGKKPKWDDDKKAIARGMEKLVHGDCKIEKQETYTDENGNEQTRPCYEFNLLEKGLQTVFDNDKEANSHNVLYDSFDIRPYAEAAIKALCGIHPDSDKPLSQAELFANTTYNERIQKIVELIEEAKQRESTDIKNEMKKCQYYEGMEAGILTMYAIDKALEGLELDGILEN
jgi:hypothetical protein